MNLQNFPTDPRFQELLAGFVLGDLDAGERVELERLAREANFDLSSLDYSSLEAAAGAVVAVCAWDQIAGPIAGPISGELSEGPSEGLPAGLREKLVRAGDEFAAGAVSGVVSGAGMGASRAAGDRQTQKLAIARDMVEAIRSDAGSRNADRNNAGRPSRSVFAWVAAAAAIVLAAVAWLNAPTRTPAPMTYEQFVQVTPDVVRSAWGDWAEPEIKGVTGEVVWSPSRQQGFMVFKGLPINDPTKEQYQLWIVDERGLADATGQSARISGGVFSIATTGEVVVPIDPALKVGKAQLFALTIEKPGGTWVSDMTRRVVAAAVK